MCSLSIRVPCHNILVVFSIDDLINCVFGSDALLCQESKALQRLIFVVLGSGNDGTLMCCYGCSRSCSQKFRVMLLKHVHILTKWWILTLEQMLLFSQKTSLTTIVGMSFFFPSPMPYVSILFDYALQFSTSVYEVFNPVFVVFNQGYICFVQVRCGLASLGLAHAGLLSNTAPTCSYASTERRKPSHLPL